MCNIQKNMSADHIGPISLGFIHDPINFQGCCSNCNSGKNNRLTDNDIQKLKLLEKKGFTVISWWAKDCWEKNKLKRTNEIRAALVHNSKKFLKILEYTKKYNLEIIKEYVNNTTLIDTNTYTISDLTIDNQGQINYNSTTKLSNKKTKQTQLNRMRDILLEKSNRKIIKKLTNEEITILKTITPTTFKSTIRRVLQV